MSREREPRVHDCIRIDGKLHTVVVISSTPESRELDLELVPLGDLLTRYRLVADDQDEPIMLGDALIAAGWTPPQ